MINVLDRWNYFFVLVMFAGTFRSKSSRYQLTSRMKNFATLAFTGKAGVNHFASLFLILVIYTPKKVAIFLIPCFSKYIFYKNPHVKMYAGDNIVKITKRLSSFCFTIVQTNRWKWLLFFLVGSFLYTKQIL